MRLKQLAAAAVLSLLSTELPVFTAAQGGKEKDQGKDQSISPPTLSPSAVSELTDSLVAPKPAVDTGGFKNGTPLPTMFGTFLATSFDASSSTAVTGGGTTFTAPPTETFTYTMQLSDKTCPGSLAKQIVIDPSAILYYHLEPSDPGDNNGILCGRLEVTNNDGGWIGLGWSSNGNMIGGEAIVGLTNARSVLKYSLTSKMASGVTPMSAERQTLTDTSIRLVGDKTIMTFTKMLLEDGEIEIYETGPNAFLHARGSNGQTLGYHDNGRFVFVKDFLDDIKTDPPTRRPTPIPTLRPVSTPNPTEMFIRPTVPVFTPNPTEIFTRIPVPGVSPPGPFQSYMPTNVFTRLPGSQTSTPPGRDPTMRPVPVGPMNCDSPFMTKEECQASIYCEWVLISGQKNYCQFGPLVPPTVPTEIIFTTQQVPDVSAPGPFQSYMPTNVFTRPPGSQTSTPPGRDPTMRPVPVGPMNCDSPFMTKEECQASIYCEWVLISGQKNYCQFGPLVPPTLRPSPPPAIKPTFGPTFEPTPRPSFEPTFKPTPQQTERPTASPTIITLNPTTSPLKATLNPTESPSYKPSPFPTQNPSTKPTALPTQTPSATLSEQPSSSPSTSSKPSMIPSSFPTLSSKPTLSTSPTYSPTKTHFPTLPEYEYKRPQRVDLRWTPWDDLDRDIQIEVSEALGYNKINWNNLKTNDVEKLRWSDLSERKKAAATMLGYDEWSWNCWINNFESFSWRQLYEWELTPYLESLGWNSQRWNSQNGPPVLKQKRWDDLTNEQRESARQLCFYKTSYDELNIVEYGFGFPIERPAARFVPWADLDSETQATMEQSLGYNDFNWNNPGLNPSELKGWFEMTDSEKRGAEAINCTDSCWDCWQAQYNSYGWQDLVNRGHNDAYAGLGWSESSWCGDAEPPATSKRSWDELTEQEQLNATELCLDRFSWDKTSLEGNTGPFPFILPPVRYKQWSSLTFDQQQIAKTALLYKEETWDNVGTADIEMRLFDDLTDSQKIYAVELGFYEQTWDCFQNHYRAETWRELSPDIRSASEVLGWNQSSWGITKPTPAIYEQQWDRLSATEQAAATTLCYNRWPGGARDQLVGSFVHEGVKSQAARMLPKVAIAASIHTLLHIFI